MKAATKMTLVIVAIIGLCAIIVATIISRSEIDNKETTQAATPPMPTIVTLI